MGNKGQNLGKESREDGLQRAQSPSEQVGGRVNSVGITVRLICIFIHQPKKSMSALFGMSSIRRGVSIIPGPLSLPAK